MHVIIRTDLWHRSLRVLQDLNKVVEDLSKMLTNVLVDLTKFFIKILKDPGQDFQGFLRIFKFLKILEDPRGSFKLDQDL